MSLKALRKTAEIARIPAGTDLDARETVIPSIRCSDTWPAGNYHKERADLATTTVAYQVLVEADDQIERRMRFILPSGNDLNIAYVAPWPDLGSPAFYALTLEEGG